MKVNLLRSLYFVITMYFDIKDTTLEYKRTPKERDNNYLEEDEAIVKRYNNAPLIENGGDRAFYRPSQDLVVVPHIKDFNSPEEYYSTLFHELVHSTGHPSRLDREGITGTIKFGSAKYSREELIAEVGASMLCGHSGFVQKTLDNSASYIQSWINALKGDSRLVVQASSRAQKACEHILGEMGEASE